MATSIRPNTEIMDIYTRQVQTVYRVCYSFMKNPHETEDMVQETFLRLITSGKTFENPRHERAWLIVTASNACKDLLKRPWRREDVLQEYEAASSMIVEPENPVLDAILSLPKDYKTVVYMFYYEGYSTEEIARHLRCAEGTVRSRLTRARKQLQKLLGGDAL